MKDCALVEDETDGVTFDSSRIVAEEITKDAVYQGTRVQIAGRMDNVRLNVQIDFGVGDVVIPGPRLIEYPALLDQPAVKLRAYPVEAAVAEKFQAMVALDAANSRVKDFYDVWTFARNLHFDGPTLAQSIAGTFKQRETTLPTELPTGLTANYFEADEHVRQWRAFVRRIGETDIADAFEKVVAEIAGFLMPPTLAAARGQKFAANRRTLKQAARNFVIVASSSFPISFRRQIATRWRHSSRPRHAGTIRAGTSSAEPIATAGLPVTCSMSSDGKLPLASAPRLQVPQLTRARSRTRGTTAIACFG